MILKHSGYLNQVWVHVRYAYLLFPNLLRSGMDKLALSPQVLRELVSLPGVRAHALSTYRITTCAGTQLTSTYYTSTQQDKPL